MKIKEIISEDISAADQLSGEDSLTSNLMPVLMFLKKRSEDKELSPTLRTDSFIQLVQNAGDESFDYNSLVDAFEDNDQVKELIKSFNKESITLKSDADIDDDDQEHSSGEEEDYTHVDDPEATVKSMAHSAAKERE